MSVGRATAYIALGANLDRPKRQVETALKELSRLADSRLTRASGLYLSRAVGHPDQPDYVNAVARLRTALDPCALLDALLAIEHRHGRERTFKNAPRTLDLDILLYDDLTIDHPGLHVPHPRMHERAFVLMPLLEIAPDCVIPKRGACRDLLAGLDTRGVQDRKSVV
jgi:2-amino-4-hydroxy-6-hydroxymethyldihydropteridine diphosphokinase